MARYPVYAMANKKKAKKTTKKSGSGEGKALTLAKKAYKLASRTSAATTETKFFENSYNARGLHGSGGHASSAYANMLTYPDTGEWYSKFNSDPLTGNRAYCKYLTGEWSINQNDEEEAITYTVAVIKPKANMKDGSSSTFDDHVDVNNGRATFDPRYIKVLYRKSFTIYPGGSLGGDRSGTVIKQGRFFIPVNKVIRFESQGSTGAVYSKPSNVQDQIWFCVWTNNSSLDAENPVMNYCLNSVWRDVDMNS